MRAILVPGSIAVAGLVASCAVHIPFEPMPSWVEGTRSPFQGGDEARSVRFVPISLKAEFPLLQYDPERGVALEAPQDTPAYLLVYVYTDEGPDRMVPVLDVRIGEKSYWCAPSEYAYGPSLLPLVASLEERQGDEEPRSGPVLFLAGEHQFRYPIVVESAEPITIKVSERPGHPSLFGGKESGS